MKNKKFVVCFYTRVNGELVERRENAVGTKSAVKSGAQHFARINGLRFVRMFEGSLLDSPTEKIV